LQASTFTVRIQLSNSQCRLLV